MQLFHHSAHYFSLSFLFVSCFFPFLLSFSLERQQEMKQAAEQARLEEEKKRKEAEQQQQQQTKQEPDHQPGATNMEE